MCVVCGVWCVYVCVCVCACVALLLWQSGAACGSADLFVTHVCVCVRVLCHRVRVYVVVVVVQCVCAHVLALCCGSLGLHAAVRTYLPPARACDVPPRVCVCACVCVCAYRPFALEVGCCTQLCGLICRPLVCVMCALCSGSLVLYVAVRTYCLAPRSGSLVLDALVRTYVLALCSANLVLHAAVRTYCPHFCACDVSPRVCVCVCVRVLRQSGAECDCADLFVGPLPWQSGAACGCADLFVTCLRV